MGTEPLAKTRSREAEVTGAILIVLLNLIRGPVRWLHDKVASRAESAGRKDDPRIKRLLATLGNGRASDEDLGYILAFVFVFFIVLVWVASYAYFIVTYIVRFLVQFLR